MSALAQKRTLDTVLRSPIARLNSEHASKALSFGALLCPSDALKCPPWTEGGH
jgi:hypothetical protein